MKQVKAILTSSPEVYRALHDDYAPRPQEWEPIDHPLVSYVAVCDDDKQELLGMAIVSAHSTIKWEIHNAIFPYVGWKKRVQVGQEFLRWLWASGCKRVIGRVVASNRYAIRFNEIMGMELVGIERKSFMRNGQLEDELYFGLSCPGEV